MILPKGLSASDRETGGQGMKKAFTGGTVITGRPEDAPRRADVVVEDGGIVEIAPGAGAQAQERVDCSGRYIVPKPWGAGALSACCCA